MPYRPLLTGVSVPKSAQQLGYLGYKIATTGETLCCNRFPPKKVPVLALAARQIEALRPFGLIQPNFELFQCAFQFRCITSAVKFTGGKLGPRAHVLRLGLADFSALRHNRPPSKRKSSIAPR